MCIDISLFNLHFPDDICGVPFHVLICYLYISFGEVRIKIFDLFLIMFVFLLNFKTSLHVLGNNPLSDVSFVNTFSQSVACILILSTSSFIEQKFFNFGKVHAAYQFFLSRMMSLVLYLKSHCHTQGHLGFHLLSSRSFIALYFIFRIILS